MKSKKILKIVLIIIFILLIIGCIYIGRNTIILNKLSKAKEEMYSHNNYSYNMKATTPHGNVEEKYFYKDGKLLIELNNGSITTNWYNEESKESITLSPSDMIAYIGYIDKIPSESFDMTCSSILSNKLKSAVRFFIGNKDIDGKKYYTISLLKNKDFATYYFNKKTGLLEIIKSGEITIKFDNFTVNELKDDDISRPDLSEYTIIQKEGD